MDQDQRRARMINMRKARPLQRPKPARIPQSVLANLDAIDAATDNPAIHGATARIRAALTGADPTEESTTP